MIKYLISFLRDNKLFKIPVKLKFYRPSEAWYPICVLKINENKNNIKVFSWLVFQTLSEQKVDLNHKFTFAAVNGIEPLKNIIIFDLITLYPQYFQLITTDLNINEVSDLKNKSLLVRNMVVQQKKNYNSTYNSYDNF